MACLEVRLLRIVVFGGFLSLQREMRQRVQKLVTKLVRDRMTLCDGQPRIHGDIDLGM